MPFSKAQALRAKKQARGVHVDCPKALLLPPGEALEVDACPSLLDELVQQQEADRARRFRPHHHAKKAAAHLKRAFSFQGKRAQQEQQQQLKDLEFCVEASKVAPAAPVGLKGFDSTCTLTTAASDDASEWSSSSTSGDALGFVDPEDSALEELAAAMAYKSLEEALHPAHHHGHHARHHTKHQKKAAHLGRLHTHADLDMHAPIRFMI